VAVTGFNFHKTSEGTVSYGFCYSDCKEVVHLQPNDWQTYFGNFVGTTIQTNSGEIMGGQFARVITENGICTQAYVYTKNQDPVCTVTPYLYLGYDDKCYSTPQDGEDHIIQ